MATAANRAAILALMYQRVDRASWMQKARPWPGQVAGPASCKPRGTKIFVPASCTSNPARLMGARPHLAAVAGIVHKEDLWQLCRDELTGVDVRLGGWDIRGRWFGVVVGATPRLGELRRSETIPWRVIAAQIAPREHRGSR